MTLKYQGERMQNSQEKWINSSTSLFSPSALLLQSMHNFRFLAFFFLLLKTFFFNFPSQMTSDSPHTRRRRHRHCPSPCRLSRPTLHLHCFLRLLYCYSPRTTLLSTTNLLVFDISLVKALFSNFPSQCYSYYPKLQLDLVIVMYVCMQNS